MSGTLSSIAAPTTHRVVLPAGHDVEQPVRSQAVKDLGNDRVHRGRERKKTDMAEPPKAFDHAGLLVNEPPGTTKLPSV